MARFAHVLTCRFAMLKHVYAVKPHSDGPGQLLGEGQLLPKDLLLDVQAAAAAVAAAPAAPGRDLVKPALREPAHIWAPISKPAPAQSLLFS